MSLAKTRRQNTLSALDARLNTLERLIEEERAGRQDLTARLQTVETLVMATLRRMEGKIDAFELARRAAAEGEIPDAGRGAL